MLRHILHHFPHYFQKSINVVISSRIINHDDFLLFFFVLKFVFIIKLKNSRLIYDLFLKICKFSFSPLLEGRILLNSKAVKITTNFSKGFSISIFPAKKTLFLDPVFSNDFEIIKKNCQP